jgi:hypothetical protein
MQFKRPLNLPKSRKTGTPTYVNSFQFLRANKLVLSVKLDELVNGWEIPPDVMARCKGEPLSPEELADWKAWKYKHDRVERLDSSVARYRQAAESVADTLRDACHAMENGLAAYTDADSEELWALLDEFGNRLKKAGLDRPKRPRGRPKTITIIDADEQSLVQWLPNFHKPGTPEHAEYEEAMRRAGKKPGDPL